MRRNTLPASLRLTRTVVALLAVMTSVSGCKWLDDQLAAITPRRSMRNSASFDPYENPLRPDSNAVSFASSNYPSGPGVVNLGEPEGLEADVPPFTAADMMPPGEIASALVNPIPPDAASLARGQVVYDRMCVVCHSADGQSAQSLMAPKMPLLQVWPLSEGNATVINDGYIYGMIRVGRGFMPAYGSRITHFDRWHVVNYVRELQRRAGAAAPANPGQANAPEGPGGI